MKPSSAKYLPFFVLGEEGSLYIFTHYIREHTHAGVSSRDPNESGVSHSLLGEIAFTGRAGHSRLSGAFKMTMIRDTSWGASASSSASFAPRSLTLFRSLVPLVLSSPSPVWSRHRPLVLLNHYKPSSTLNRKQALVHGRASTRKHLNPTIKSHLWS